MSKRFSRGRSDSPAKRIKLDITREQSSAQKDYKKGQQNVPQDVLPDDFNDLWGDDFGEDEIEEMDIIASQATQEERVFVQPLPVANSKKSPKYSTPMECLPSTSSGFRGPVQGHFPIVASQIISSNDCLDVDKEIIESTQAIMFDDFQSNIKVCMNSTLINGQTASQNNVVMVTDDDQVEKWKEEKKKLLEDFLTKEGETEFLRQQLNQIQARAENAKKEQARILEEKERQMAEEKNALLREKSTLESSIQLLNLQVNSMTEKCKLLESGAVKFAQPQANVCKFGRERSNSFNTSTIRKAKTKEISVQVEEVSSVEHLKTTIILYPLKSLPQFAFEPSEPEKSVVDVKLEEKIGKRNLAIIQDEETFRIFENPELSKPKVTIIDDKNLSTEFYLPDLAKLVNKSSDEINSFESIPIINKMVVTSLELLLNATLVLKKISQALQNDDIRDMNEFYMSEFYEMPVPHTKSTLEARSWYDLERGIEARRAIGTLSHIVTSCTYLGNFVAGKVNLNISKDVEYQRYIKQMKSYQAWNKKGHDFEFLNLFLDFITVVGVIRRAHHFTGLINAILTLIINVQSAVGFCDVGLKRINFILREVIFCRPLLACFIPICNVMKEFSNHDGIVKTFCISPNKSGVNYWKGSPVFTPDCCPLEILLAQLETYKLDPVTLIHLTKDLTAVVHKGLMTLTIPWLDTTLNSCNCCLNLLKYVMIYQCECSKLDVDKLKSKYVQDDLSWRISRYDVYNKKQTISWKDQLHEDWANFEKNRNDSFWHTLKLLQFSAVSDGIRLLSFIANRDTNFTIRLTFIEDAFHVFLLNVTKRNYFKLKTYDETALDLVKRTFDLEKNVEEIDSCPLRLDLIDLESQRWTEVSPSASLDLSKLYDTLQ